MAVPPPQPRRRHLLRRRSAAVRGRALVHTYYILCTSGFVVYVVGTSSWSGAAEFRINVKFRMKALSIFSTLFDFCKIYIMRQERTDWLLATNITAWFVFAI